MVRTKQTRKAQPYDELDLFRPATEGRSLHDDANSFYREIMEIETPINPNNLPKSKDVQKAILQIPREKKITDILFNLFASEPKELWPKSTDPPGDFIGVLWHAVRKAWEGENELPPKSPEKEGDSVNTKVSSVALANKPPPPAGKEASQECTVAKKNEPYTLQFMTDKDNSIMLPMEVYFPLLQDRGQEISKKKRPKNMFIPKTANMNRASLGYVRLHELSTKLYDIMKDNADTFCRIPKNKCNVITRIARWLYDNREEKSLSVIDDPDLIQFIEDQNLKSTDDNVTYFVYDQKYVFQKMHDAWCTQGIEKEQVCLNDRLRIFGILLSQEHRDDINRITSGVQSREELDNPSLQVKETWNRIAKSFNSPQVRVSHPDKYEDITNYQIFDPNELERVAIPRDGVWIKRQYNDTMKYYREALNKWNMGTGGGPNHPPDYFCVEDRDDKHFQEYDRTRGALLCWIFMHDKKVGFILDAKNQSLPPDYSVETGGRKKTTNNKRSKTPSPDEQMKRLCKTINDSTNALLRQKNKVQKSSDSRSHSNDGQLSESGSELTCTIDQHEDNLLSKAQRIENLIESINKNRRISKKERETRIKTLDKMLSRVYNEMSTLSQKQQLVTDVSNKEHNNKCNGSPNINFQTNDLFEDNDKE